jgi:uncharacterized repeat protein (TIGR03803 family)
LSSQPGTPLVWTPVSSARRPAPRHLATGGIGGSGRSCSGIYPNAVTLDSHGNLFGTTSSGGLYNDGTIFEIAQGSTNITTLASFDSATGDDPLSALTIDGSGNLFGTTTKGGAAVAGTIFELVQGSSSITTLASFSPSTGIDPSALVEDSSGDLFGTTATGGGSSSGGIGGGGVLPGGGGSAPGGGDGTVFELVQGSSSITTRATFNGSNGADPNGVIRDASGNLYGTTQEGGVDGGGTVFELTQGSSSISVLASFNGTLGEDPVTTPILTSSGLVGSTQTGGAYGDGVLFALPAGSSSLSVLASFDNTDGQAPSALTMDGNGNLYGTTEAGGANDEGLVFELPQGSTTLTSLGSFNGANGEIPNDLVRDSSGNLFGTTAAGGTSGDGVVFEIAAPLPTSTTLTSSANPAAFGQTVTFSATVSASSGTPTGSVAFYANGTLLGNGTLNGSGVATWSTSTLAVGSQTITANYGGDSNDAGSESAVLTQNVNQAATTTSLTSSVNPASYGESVTFTATVSVSSPGVGTPTGTVTFSANGSTLGSGTLNGSGVATYTTSTLPGGNQNITASYIGASNFAGSTSTTLPQVVNQAPAITSPTATTFTTTAVGTFTVTTTGYPNATVTESGSLPGGVTFTSNSDGTATLSGTPAAGSSGTYPLTFTANNGINPEATQDFTLTVNQASTTTTLTPSVNPSVTGQSVTFTATVSGSSGTPTPTGSVTFYANGTPLGSDTLNGSGVAIWSTSTLAVGSQTITANYGGDSNYAGSESANLTQTVNQAATTTRRMSSVNPSVFGQTVTFTATVSASSPGSGIPTGTVTFYANGTFLGDGTLNGSGVAEFSTSTLSVGSQTITASYGGDANYTSSTSTALTQTVNQADTTTSLAPSDNPSVYGQEVTFTASVTANCPGSGTPSGTVTFTDASGSYPETLTDGEATWTTSALAVGDTTVTASYSGSTDYTSSYDVVTQTVNQAETTTDLTATPEEAAAGQTVTFTATVAVVEPGTGTPTGNVLFFEDDQVLGEEAVNGAGVATLEVDDLSANMEHSVTAEYEGDTNYEASDSDPVLVTVASISTTTAVVTDPTSPAEGEPVTLTATVSPASVYADEPPTGTVTFTVGSLNLGTADLNEMLDADQAVLTTTDLPAGDQTITATYSGDDTYESSTGTTDLTVTASTAWGLTADVPDDDPLQGYLVPEGEANLDLNQGGVRISQPLDFSQSAAARADASFALTYNSATVNHPIVVNAVLDTDAAAGTPTDITAVLTVPGQIVVAFVAKLWL